MADCCNDKACDIQALRQRQSATLKQVLAINAVMFLVELSVGWILSGGRALQHCFCARPWWCYGALYWSYALLPLRGQIPSINNGDRSPMPKYVPASKLMVNHAPYQAAQIR